MNGRIEEKIADLERFINYISTIIPTTYTEYATDQKTKAACERYFELIVEAIVDITFLVIKNKKFPNPEDDKQAFDFLMNEGVISEPLSKKLKEAKGMRNLLAHQYGKIDDELIYFSLTTEIVPDAKTFLTAIKTIKK